ncbi:hypothetical protein MPNT_230004 [Candidatus Methylacidithermus pantelleriae]|uniref:Uncharacterized protein n=1 Tax=Candidatus Methylacidithermus pantelleriae TaxID=2744239 RepID=A0A8J2FSB6_9BACT|nr:hypothetical protein MPNT_230004 [Candidatus Methylacidithermus pantelleriae]
MVVSIAGGSGRDSKRRKERMPSPEALDRLPRLFCPRKPGN